MYRSAGWTVAVVAVLVGWSLLYPVADRSFLIDAPARWSEWEGKLEKSHGPMEFIGRLDHAWDGLDVYRTADGRKWWLVACGGVMAPCLPTRESAKAVAERIVLKLSVEMPLPEGQRNVCREVYLEQGGVLPVPLTTPAE